MARTLLPCLVLGIAAGLAPAQQTRVVPHMVAKVDGSTSSAYPFGYTTGRSQQLIDGVAFCKQTAILLGFAFRRDGRGTTTMKGRTVPSLKVTLYTTPVTPAGMSKTFASNRAGTPTVVFPAASFVLPNLPPGNPGAFLVKWAWKTPFVYNRANGNLLIEIEIPGQVGKSEYFVDAHQAKTLPGQASNFGTPGPFAGKDAYMFEGASLPSLLPGGKAELSVTGLKKSYVSLALYSNSNRSFGSFTLPFDLGPLGAQGNHLYVKPLIAVALNLTQVGATWLGSVSLPLPGDAWLAGVSIYGQGIFADPPSNSLGLVFSDGVEMRLGLPTPPIQLLGTYDSTLATGNLSTNPYGLVVQLSGVFN